MGTLAKFPAQKKADSKKTDPWKIECVDGAECAAIYSEEEIRKSKYNKSVNYNLYSNILDQKDVEQICNPLKLKGFTTPVKMQNYPLCNPKIDVLIGEEETRSFEWRVRVTNEDAISEKETRIKEAWKSFVLQQIQAESTSEEELQRKLAGFKKYMDYEYQDIREQRATWILRDIYAKNNLNRLFNKGFKDALIASEEIYHWDIIGSEPKCFKLNPKNVYTIRSGESSYIEDSDIIVIEEYYSLGRVIDEYNEYLSEGEIDRLESYFSGNKADKMTSSTMYSNSSLILKVQETIDESMLANDVTESSSPFDTDGNIRVVKAYWKSMRKMLKRKFYDEDGEEQSDLMPENYTPRKDLGEEVETLWISEWWEGHKIAGSSGYDKDAIYVRMQPKKVQYRSMHNPSKCHPGIVGTVYNTNDNKGISLMDRMKPYQYLYNSIWYNTELLIATNWGKIMKIPLHEMPDGWDEDMWLYYAKIMKAVPYDAFKEGKKGAALGKVAGNMQQQNPVLDMEMGNTLQFYMMVLQYIEQKMGEIAGISPQRMGAIQSRETLGGVERSVTQSSMITEYWFAEHDFLKKRVLEIGLETAKIAYKGKKLLRQFGLDDFLSKIDEVDGDDFSEADYGLVISSGWKDKEAYQTIKHLSQSALQSGMMDFSQLLDLLTSESISAMRRKFSVTEKEKKDYEEMKMQKQSELQNQQIQAAAQDKQADRDFQMAMEDKKVSNLITLERIKKQLEVIGKDTNENAIADAIELEKLKSQEAMLEKELTHDSKEKAKDREHESKENKEDRVVESKKITASKAKKAN